MAEKVVKFSEIQTKNKEKKLNRAILANDDMTIAELYSEELIGEFRRNLKRNKNTGGKNKNGK